tara:strand:- start:252 stop:917 length:666 start_codon:yes stop_codon:yes gene_type:complete
MDIIKAKPITPRERLVAQNVRVSEQGLKGGETPNSPPSNMDNARYVMCSNLRGQGQGGVARNNGYIIIGTSDLAQPVARVRITTKTNDTTFTVTSSNVIFTPNPSFADGTSQLNKVIRTGVGALTDANGNNITVASWSRTSANTYDMTTSAALTQVVGVDLWFGDITGRVKSSTLLPPRCELIVEKEPSDVIYGSNGINGNMANNVQGRIDFTRVERIRID